MGSHDACVDRLVELYADIAVSVDLSIVGLLSVFMFGVGHVFLPIHCLEAAVVIHAFPVIVFRFAGCRHIVAVDVVAGAESPERFICRVSAASYRYVCHSCLVLSSGAGLIVVVDHIYISAARTAVAGAAVAPVIHDVVSEVDALGIHRVFEACLVPSAPFIACAVEAWHSVLHVGEVVVVERGFLAAPDSAIAVCALGVARIGESFAERTPLHGEFAVVVE